MTCQSTFWWYHRFKPFTCLNVKIDLGDCYNLQVEGFMKVFTKLPSYLKFFEVFWPFQPAFNYFRRSKLSTK